MQKSINPYDQTLLAQFPLMNEKDVEGKVMKGNLTYKSWKKTPFSQRAELMNKVAEILEKNSDEYAKTITLEMGKILQEAKNEVKKCADGCRYFAANAEQFLSTEQIRTEAKGSYVVYEPTGVIVAIMPWNFPFWQVFRFAAPALMAGNVGILKHSSNTPQCSMLIEKIFREAGFPDGAFQSVLIDNGLIDKILEHDAVQGVALTGSETAGSIVGSLAGKHIKKSVLELGGSDPFIVLPDADLNLTTRIAAQSRMQNAGQSCIAAKRFIVHNEIRDAFIDQFKSRVESIKQGDPMHADTGMGPLARVDLAESLEKQLQASLKKGARLITGSARNGANFQPTILDNVLPGMEAFDEETFGPLASVTYVNTDEEAIALANMSRYGLGASVWTSDLVRGERVAREIEAGTVYVNSLMRSDSRMPFGGIKKSGYGRELAALGIREFTNAKSVSINEVK